MNKKKRISFVSGHFNVLHPGHLRLLRFAKECGDYLIVAVESDRIAGDSAHVKEDLRLEYLKNNTWVDEAFIFDEPIGNLISKLKPNFVIKGKEHEYRDNPELETIKKYGGSLIFSSGETTFSSYDLIKKEFDFTSNNTIEMPDEYINRHNISKEKIKKIIQDFSSVKVCVIGDLIIDEYITCQPLGMSQEDPTIVVTPIDSTQFLGGSAIVAAHAAGLGAGVEYISVVGDDEMADLSMDMIKKYKFNVNLFRDNSRKTILKKRYRSNGKTLLRVNSLQQNTISLNLQDKVYKKFEQIVEDIDLLVFSDFNYGCLPQGLVDKITKIAKEKKIVLAADSQSSSQLGDVSRFKHMDLLFPTEQEARISIKSSEDGLVVLAEKILNFSNASNVLLKLGAEGVIIQLKDSCSGWNTDRISALNSQPKDVAGAGDSMLITSAMSYCLNKNVWEAALIGSIASFVQVGRVGNSPLKKEELLREIK